MSKHAFQIGNKLGGNKPKPYKTKVVFKRVPEDIHAKIISDIEATVKEYLKTLKKD